MKKFLAMTMVGAMAFLAAACSKEKKNETPEPVAATEEAEEKIEENVEEIIGENQKKTNEADGTLFGLTYEVPDDWSSGNAGDYIWIAPPGKGNAMFFVVFDGDPGDDFNVMGTGKFTSQVEGTEPIDIDFFKAGNFLWHGYSINFPGYFGPETIVLLASDVDSKTGKAVGAKVYLGLDEEPDFSLDDADIQSILASAEFLY